VDRAANIAISGVIVFVLGWIVGLIFPRRPVSPSDDPRLRVWGAKALLKALGIGLALGAMSLGSSVYGFNRSIVVDLHYRTYPGKMAGWFFLILGWSVIGFVGCWLSAMIRTRHTAE